MKKRLLNGVIIAAYLFNLFIGDVFALAPRSRINAEDLREILTLNPSEFTIKTAGTRMSIQTPERGLNFYRTQNGTYELLKDGWFDYPLEEKLISRNITEFLGVDAPKLLGLNTNLRNILKNNSHYFVTLFREEIRLTKPQTKADWERIIDRYKNINPEILNLVESLDLRGFGQITDDVLAVLVKSCPKLKTLAFYGCDQLTDAGLAVLAAGCPKLETLHLFYCNNITDDGLAVLAGRM